MRSYRIKLCILWIYLFVGSVVHLPAADTLAADLSAGDFPDSSPADTVSGLTVHFLDVGEGLCVLMESEGRYAIYDGGDPEHSSFTVRYLKEQGVETLDYVIASHYDRDHISGLIGVINAFSCGFVMGPDYTEDSSVFLSFCTSVENKNLSILHPAPGETYTFGDAAIEILGPLRSFDSSNDNSIVIRVSCKGHSLLLTGDAGEESEIALIESGQNLQADILSAAHHGSSHSTGSDFLRAVSPEAVVISCGADNEFGHPAPSVLRRISEAGAVVFRTDLEGTIVALLDPDGIFWNTYPTTEESMGEIRYILNIKSMKFHLPSCETVQNISPLNSLPFDGDREEAMLMGYEPCGICRP